MNIKKILLTSVLIWIVGSILGVLTCGWLFNWVYTIPPIIWKTPAEMFTATNMIGSYALGFLVSVIFVTVFTILKKGIPGKGLRKGLNYGLLIWSVSALSGMITMPFFMTISTTVIIYWIIQALVVNLINGMIVAKLN